VERVLYKPKAIFSLKNRKAINNPEIFRKQRIARRVYNEPLKRIKSVYSFEVLKKTAKTAVLLVTPETGRLPDEMGTLARYISCKSGGLGEVVSALCEGLRARGIECHLATLNLKKRFQKESNVDEDKWQEIRHKIDPDKVHLVSSSIFANLSSAYAGDPILNAAEFQKGIVNNIIKNVRAKNGGRLILHSHDWMAGGAITAYAKLRGCPVLHTIHNVHTGHIPPEMLFGVDIDSLVWNIFFSEEHGKRCIDSQATAIKNATLINFVGEKFLKEIIDDYFLDRPIISPSIRQEVKAKYYQGAALAIINAPSPGLYSERCNHLVRNYGPKDDIIAAKKENLIEFQKRTGLMVNSEAILLYWPSRLDPSQKGVELLEDIALKFVIENADVQIAIVGDGVGRDRNHEEILGRIACASGGKIIYQHFSEELSTLGYAAASDVFGASLYEPCGQIDQLGNIFGATATNRDTGGYHDKIKEMSLMIDGASHDEGNGFLFQDYDSGGLWYGLNKSVQFHRKSLEIREKQIKRIMRETRQKYDLNTMVDKYIKVYETLNGGNQLA
jgi:glycogen synthase